RTEYWSKIKGIDQMSQAQALVAFDAAVNHGVSYANKLVSSNGGDVDKMLDQRSRLYTRIVQNDPSQRVFKNGWSGRISTLAAITKPPAYTTDGAVQYAEADKTTPGAGIKTTVAFADVSRLAEIPETPTGMPAWQQRKQVPASMPSMST
ncbi:MAG TPA: hypothetical protein VIF12_01025, partial [Micavibrio sp.]